MALARGTTATQATAPWRSRMSGTVFAQNAARRLSCPGPTVTSARVAKAPPRDLLQALAVIAAVVFLVLSVVGKNDEGRDGDRRRDPTAASHGTKPDGSVASLPASTPFRSAMTAACTTAKNVAVAASSARRPTSCRSRRCMSSFMRLVAAPSKTATCSCWPAGTTFSGGRSGKSLIRQNTTLGARLAHGARSTGRPLPA